MGLRILLLAMALSWLAPLAWAQEKSIEFTGYSSSTTTVSEWTEGAATLTFSKGSGSNAPKWDCNTNPNRLWFYKNNSLTVSLKEGAGHITKISFGLVKAYPLKETCACSTGVMSQNLWTATESASEVVIENASGSNAAFTSVTVYYEAQALACAAPAFSADGDVVTVSVENAERVYVSVNGGEAEEHSGDTAEVAIAGSCAIEAWGANAQGEGVRATRQYGLYYPLSSAWARATSFDAGKRYVVATTPVGGDWDADYTMCGPRATQHGEVYVPESAEFSEGRGELLRMSPSTAVFRFDGRGMLNEKTGRYAQGPGYVRDGDEPEAAKVAMQYGWAKISFADQDKALCLLCNGAGPEDAGNAAFSCEGVDIIEQLPKMVRVSLYAQVAERAPSAVAVDGQWQGSLAGLVGQPLDGMAYSVAAPQARVLDAWESGGAAYALLDTQEGFVVAEIGPSIAAPSPGSELSAACAAATGGQAVMLLGYSCGADGEAPEIAEVSSGADMPPAGALARTAAMAYDQSNGTLRRAFAGEGDCIDAAPLALPIAATDGAFVAARGVVDADGTLLVYAVEPAQGTMDEAVVYTDQPGNAVAPDAEYRLWHSGGEEALVFYTKDGSDPDLSNWALDPLRQGAELEAASAQSARTASAAPSTYLYTSPFKLGADGGSYEVRYVVAARPGAPENGYTGWADGYAMSELGQAPAGSEADARLGAYAEGARVIARPAQTAFTNGGIQTGAAEQTISPQGGVAEYYGLDGVRIAAPRPGALCIRRLPGQKPQKVIFR